MVKQESEKSSFKLIVQKTEITVFSPITLWQIEGEKVEAVADFIFLGSKITVESDCSHEIKRGLLLCDKPRQSIKKQRHRFADKGPYCQSYIFFQ